MRISKSYVDDSNSYVGDTENSASFWPVYASIQISSHHPLAGLICIYDILMRIFSWQLMQMKIIKNRHQQTHPQYVCTVKYLI